MTRRQRLIDLAALNHEVTGCRLCPRLVSWREQVATEKRAAFADQTYWGRPIPGLGDVDAGIVIVGLAPAAHGGNRTGRIFTGDRSGDWLFAALHRAGLANQPTSVSADDGLELINTYISAAVKCAPPANKPTLEERDTCMTTYLRRELELLSSAKVLICLGKFAYDAVAALSGDRSRPKFGHGVELQSRNPEWPLVLCCFHPSQQNTFTGKLTEPMLDDIFRRAVELSALA